MDEQIPSKKGDASAVSTSTTASLTTQHTTDAILNMQRQWKKEKDALDQKVQTKLQSVDNRIQSALSSFRSELSTTLAAHVQGVITTQQTQVVQIALAALTSTLSPYVTNEQLQEQFPSL
jgi:hypothetical protein